MKKKLIKQGKTIDFYEFGAMIKCLLIGLEDDIQLYSGLISQLNYFGEQTFSVVNDNAKAIETLDYRHFDAIFIVSQIENISTILSNTIQKTCKIYFVDQKALTKNNLKALLDLHLESNNLLYPEIIELQHPLVQEFISTRGSHLLFRYNKSFSSKKYIRQTLLNALCFLTILSPMQVKKIDVNTIEATKNNTPTIKIRLKMYDSSIGYIILKFENRKEHSILIESKHGSFTFNFTENYIENFFGTRFKSDEITHNELILKTLESFALCILLNEKPTFTFYHYTLSINLLIKIENILQNYF